MHIKSIVHELREIRDRIKDIAGRKLERRHVHRQGRSHIVPETTVPTPSCPEAVQQGPWANLPPELLLHIIKRVEASQISWPSRRDIVACASICRSWREVTKEAVKTAEQCGRLTFPISLKQRGPRDFPIQCFIRRDTANSTFFLYLGLSPDLSEGTSKLLLAARKIRRALSTDFVISFIADDFSQAGTSYVGKLRSNFIGTKFTVYDSQPPWDAAIQSNHKSHGRQNPKQVPPSVPSGKFSVATISYELNVLRSKGPRRMHCNIRSNPTSAIQEGGTAPTPTEFSRISVEPYLSPLPLPASNGKKQLNEHSSTSCKLLKSTHGAWDPLVLRNKTPRWHEQLQCWCLNFRGRVTMASVKNFQLVAALEPYQNIPTTEHDNVILQFGKIGKDIFTMDYLYPLSAFQAFAISLSSFGTKPACE
ncbi:tubby-like F-box protein 5 isoform X2 [Eucalyptus grandis]|uniref:Tubby-like F-box protein n=2 Tax=Eucalyptus grandis TaxID=71139 RepID=A0A059BQ55_EUCGR|nr:tubby-like F-box protein 5 isoform X2 [Eucalyptus grandis]KAK3425363.1 hypothetical protein EUGRSUZ_F01885 [Eucalyptus grandis]